MSAVDTAKDRDDTDIWLASWDGTQQLRLTRHAGSDHAARWSPDGRYVAYLSDRDDPREVEQVWLLDRRGGEPERITNLPGGVSDLAWSPDGRRLALVVTDPDPDAKAPGDSSTKAPKPIVLDRFQFKEDETGWLRELHDHLYLLDLATRATTLLLPGAYDEAMPAWSPDGHSIAFASRRRRSTTAPAITTSTSSRPEPARSRASSRPSRDRTRIPSGAVARRPGARTGARSHTCRAVR